MHTYQTNIRGKKQYAFTFMRQLWSFRKCHKTEGVPQETQHFNLVASSFEHHYNATNSYIFSMGGPVGKSSWSVHDNIRPSQWLANTTHCSLSLWMRENVTSNCMLKPGGFNAAWLPDIHTYIVDQNTLKNGSPVVVLFLFFLLPKVSVQDGSEELTSETFASDIVHWMYAEMRSWP